MASNVDPGEGSSTFPTATQEPTYIWQLKETGQPIPTEITLFSEQKTVLQVNPDYKITIVEDARRIQITKFRWHGDDQVTHQFSMPKSTNQHMKFLAKWGIERIEL